jgi:GntR family transcriptional regulator, carbon starvation induced regulator
MASVIYRRLRSDIVKGILLPGEKLRIELLTERYGVGASPTREALNRLSTESFVHRQDQRGFQVAPVSIEDLAELTRTRCLLNEVTLREAIARGDEAWEERIVLATHRLRRTDNFLSDGGVNPEWEERHRAVHSALIAACGSRWLIELYEKLFDCADRYRNLCLHSVERRDVGGEHQTIADAVIARDVTNSVQMLNRHVSEILDRVTELASNGGSPTWLRIGSLNGKN